MCVSCGELLGILDVAVQEGGCDYYTVSGTYANGAVFINSSLGDEGDQGNGIFTIVDIPCGESVTIQLINDQDCVSASKTITYNCCGTPCTIQTVEIDSLTHDGYRIYSVVSDNGACDLISGYAIVDSSDGNFVDRWDDITTDILNTINGVACGVVNECCSLGGITVSWSNVGDLVTITIENSPLQFSHITIAGLPAMPDINFDHTNC